MGLKVKPVFEKILVRVEEEKQKGLIYIPDTNRKEPPVEGEVVAWGDDVTLPLKAGMKIVFGKYAGEMSPHVKDLYIISESDIWYYIEGEPIKKPGRG